MRVAIIMADPVYQSKPGLLYILYTIETQTYSILNIQDKNNFFLDKISVIKFHKRKHLFFRILIIKVNV